MTDTTDLFGPQAPERLDGLVDRYAHVRAVRDFADGELSRLKDRIGQQADILEDATGTTFRAPVTGIGQALRTDPQPKPKVTDHTTFASWFADTHPDVAGERRRVRITDHQALLELLDDDPHAHGELGLYVEVETTVLLPDDPCTWLIDNGHAVLGTDGLHSTTDGELIPGTGVRQSARQLQVRIDKTYQQQLADQLTARYLPELEESTP